MNLTRLFNEFFANERAGGFLLIACTIISLLLANTGCQTYIDMWNIPIAGHSLLHWINDGLMTIFFLLIGLELERELYIGELANIKSALFPIITAIGGMILPAILYALINKDSITKAGSGIPISTDIAFAIGILSLLGKRVPASLKILLMAIAIIDDIGAILVIAIFYSGAINWFYLGIALAIFLFMIVLNRIKINYLILYIILGFIMWYFMAYSGIHPTLTGIFLALAIPFRNGRTNSPSYILQHMLQKPVSWVILPLFALANTCIVLDAGWYSHLHSSGSVGIITGLIAGKPTGILIFGGAAVLAGICNLPEGLNWKHVAGVGLLGGIGFTMSIFISMLSFHEAYLIDRAKTAILIASSVAAIAGLVWLRIFLSKGKRVQ